MKFKIWIKNQLGTKAGIIKNQVPVVIGPDSKPYEIFYDISKKKNSDIYLVEHDDLTIKNFDNENNKVARLKKI